MKAVLESRVTAKNLHASAVGTVDRLRLILNRQKMPKTGPDTLVKEISNITPVIPGILKFYDGHPYLCVSFHCFNCPAPAKTTYITTGGNLTTDNLQYRFQYPCVLAKCLDCPFRRKKASATTDRQNTVYPVSGVTATSEPSGSETSVTEVSAVPSITIGTVGEIGTAGAVDALGVQDIENVQ